MPGIPFSSGQTRKLAKLTIISIPDRKKDKDGKALSSIGAALIAGLKQGLSGGLTDGLGGLLGNVPIVFEVMYNPDKYSRNYTPDITHLASSKKADPPKEVQRQGDDVVSFELIFDATGASPSNSFYGQSIASTVASGAKGVDALIAPLLAATGGLNTSTHNANRIILVWGTFFFMGVTQSVTVNYTMFDRVGRPLRANVNISFIKDDFKARKAWDVGTQSPDITKTHIVKAGDTLPLIALNEYEDESLYIELARVNNLKNYRNLVPGQTLVLPPFNKTAEA